MKKLYKFYWDCRRNGCVEGMFIADEQELKSAIGEEVNFGEILGKHSEIYGTLEEGDIKEIQVSEITLKEMEEVLGTNISGYNPLNYVSYQCDRCEDQMGVGDCDWYLDKDGNKVCEYCLNDEEKATFKQI